MTDRRTSKLWSTQRSNRSKKQRSQQRLRIERLEARQLLAFDIADDFFSLSADASLNVLGNDTSGAEVQSVSAMNVQHIRETVVKGSVADNFIPERPGQPGIPQRSVFENAMTLYRPQRNYGDVDLFLDLDADPSNDADPDGLLTGLRRNLRGDALVLGTLMNNDPLNAARTNLAVVQYTGNPESWIATNASPENDGEQAADFSAAHFPYTAGWLGASFNGATRTAGATQIVATGDAGVYEITIDGVTDSFNEGFLFALGGDNVDNYTRAQPLGGNRWQIVHRDNSQIAEQFETATDQQQFNVLYIPRSAQGLIGGVVKGLTQDVNPMSQSFGDFQIQREADGFWKLTVPNHDATSGVLIMETADTTSQLPRNTYFTYTAHPDDSSAFQIRQFDYNHGAIDLKNEDFTFFFIPFENSLRVAADLQVGRLGSTGGTLGDNLSERGIPLSLNSDGTVHYDTGSIILGLGAGESQTDRFVYEVTFLDGDGVEQIGTATATIQWNGVNDAPNAVVQPTELTFAANGPAQSLAVDSWFADADTNDVLSYSITTSTPGVVTGEVLGGNVTLIPVANATGTVTVTVTATDTHGATSSLSFAVSVIGLNAVNDVFYIGDDGVLSVLNNDKTGQETQNISAMNANLDGPQDKGGNTGKIIVPVRTDGSGLPQRSVYTGAITIAPANNNYADYALYRDADDNPNNDSGSNPRIRRDEGIVLATQRDNSPLNAAGNNLSVMQYNGTPAAAVATNAGPENDGEQAVNFGAAYFPYSAGWIGGSFSGADGSTQYGSNGISATYTNVAGRYEATVDGVNDSYSEGYLFSISGQNTDNYTRTRPAGNGKWLVHHRDNASAIGSGESGDFNLLYIPRSAPGLTGGVVNGSGQSENSMVQSFGDFTIQRESDGFWRVSVPGHSPASGMLVMESMDLSVEVPRNSYFTYDAAADNPNDFIIRQFDYLSGTKTANPQNGNFVFFFIPFENAIQPQTPIQVESVGSSAANPSDNLTANGISISINADGTINYDTAGAIRALGEGETIVDSFVYQAKLGGQTELATATIHWVGINDAPQLVSVPNEINLVENGPSASIDLAPLFSDIDANDELTYSVSLSRGDVVQATFSGSTVSFSSLADGFGFVRATVVATDSQGATAEFTLPISVRAAASLPNAVNDSVEAAKQSVVSIDVLGNDQHPDAAVYQVAGANVFGNSEAANDAETAWSIEQTGSGSNAFTLIGDQNRGDLSLGLDGQPITAQDGVLLGTIRNDQHPFGTVNVWNWADRGNTFTFATELGAGGNSERNASLAAAFFPYAEGWTGGQVAADGTLLNGHGVNQSNITKVQTGLWTVSIPGVTDSHSEGMLFAIGGANDDNIVSVLPMGGNSWLIRQVDNDSDALGFEDDPFFFVYVPFNTPDLIGGRWQTSNPDAGIEGDPRFTYQSGTFNAAASNSHQTVTIDIPGYTPQDGALIVIANEQQSVTLPNGSTALIPVHYTPLYTATADGKFEVEIRQGVNFERVSSGFQFMFIPFADPLRTPLGHGSVSTVTSVDAVSELGAAVSINADGTVRYDSTTAGGAIAALTPGQSIQDSFSYTIRDANGATSSATVAVTVRGENLAPTLELAEASDSVVGGSMTISGSFVDGSTHETQWSIEASFDGGVSWSTVGTVGESGNFGDLSINHGKSIAGNYTAKIRVANSTGEISNVVDAEFIVNAVVANRGLYYNGRFGNQLDSSKHALLPGQTSSFANYTGYIQGVTGLMVDLDGNSGTVSTADFEFSVWNGIAATGWQPLTAAASVQYLPTGGTDGANRVQITFANGSVINTWLRITVKANERTGLATPDVFYFGSVMGDVNDESFASFVRGNESDLAVIINNQSPRPNSVPVDSAFDVNKDGRVNADDVAEMLQPGRMSLFRAIRHLNV